MDIRVDEVVQQYAKRIQDRYNPKAIYLYGSYAKGTETKNSDIDIAVVINPTDAKQYMKMFSDLFVIASDYQVSIEPNLLVEDGAENKYSFLEEVKQTGRLLAV